MSIARRGAAVPHGFRSSFRDWVAEETNHPREVIEAALAHVVQNRVEAVYRRTDLFERRRRLMEDWPSYLAGEKREARQPPPCSGMEVLTAQVFKRRATSLFGAREAHKPASAYPVDSPRHKM